MREPLNNRPIGIFDSGLGGLTALKELEKRLPGENLIYFGDTGRVPYGGKGRDTIVKYARQVMRFLQEFDVKAVVIACGTVSSVAFDEVAGMSQVPVIGVVEPAAEAAVAATKNGRIGVLGTSATIRSGSYGKELKKRRPDVEVFSRACPLFVPLVENGHFNRDDPMARLAAHEYLDDFAEGADTVILGCTHYPILRGVIGDILGGGVTLIDVGAETARAAVRTLEAEGLLADGTQKGGCRFYVSDYSEDFARLAGILLEHSLTGHVEKTDIEKY